MKNNNEMPEWVKQFNLKYWTDDENIGKFEESWCWFNGGYAYYNGLEWIFLEENPCN